MNDVSVETVPMHKIGDVQLCVRAVDVLKKNYPGYVWRVFLNDDRSGGVMNILNMTINEALFGGQSYGYVLHLRRVFQDPDLKCVMRAGGEILERARLRRSWYNGDSIKHVDGVAQKNQPIEIVQ